MFGRVKMAGAAFVKHTEVLPARGGQPTGLFRFAVSLWIVFAVVCGVKALVSPIKHNSYDVFQAGSSLFLADLNVYKGTHHEFRYGPTFAFLFSPFTLLPASLGSLIWMSLNLAVFFWALRVLVREILPGRWSPDEEGLFLLLVLPAAYRGLWTAQTNTMIFACVVAALQAIGQRRWTRAALFVLPVHVKIWPLAAALLIVACWPRQLAVRFAGTLATVAALPLLTKGPTTIWTQYTQWYASIVGPMQTRHVYRDMWTVIEAFHPPLPSAYAVLQLSTAILALALCLWQADKKLHGRDTNSAQLFTFLLAIWAAWQLLFGPGTERATFGIIAPLAAWGVVTTLGIVRGRVVMLAAYGLMVLGGFGQVERALLPTIPLAAALHPLGVLVFAGWLVVYARSWPSTPHEAFAHSLSYGSSGGMQAT